MAQLNENTPPLAVSPITPFFAKSRIIARPGLPLAGPSGGVSRAFMHRYGLRLFRLLVANVAVNWRYTTSAVSG